MPYIPYNPLTKSVIPEAPIKRAAAAMTEPRLDESPLWAGVKGFGAGALEGLQRFATPLNIATAIPTVRGAVGLMQGAKAAPGAIGALSKWSADDLLGNPSSMAVMDRMYKSANPTFQQLNKGGMFSGPRNVGNLYGPTAKAAETLGEGVAEFTPVGGEAMYNVARQGLQKAADPMESVYKAIMSKMGR